MLRIILALREPVKSVTLFLFETTTNKRKSDFLYNQQFHTYRFTLLILSFTYAKMQM